MKNKKIHPVIVMLGTDIIMALTIILIGVTICVPKFSEINKMIVISAGPLEAVSNLKTDISVYYALHGEWPRDKEALLELFPDSKEWYEEMELPELDYRKYRSTIVNGAIDVSFIKMQGNNTVTVRPAIPSEDPLGPVKWIVGKVGETEGWTVIGEDHSTVDERYINKALK